MHWVLMPMEGKFHRARDVVRSIRAAFPQVECDAERGAVMWRQKADAHRRRGNPMAARAAELAVGSAVHVVIEMSGGGFLQTVVADDHELFVTAPLGGNVEAERLVQILADAVGNRIVDISG